MGAWGVGPFENDEAADWAFEFTNADLQDGLGIVRAALHSAAEVDLADYLDSDAGTAALAAADVVAFINGQPIEENAYNEAPRAWVARTRPAPDPALTALARRAIERIGREPSELVELWRETGEEEWRASVAAQLSRLA